MSEQVLNAHVWVHDDTGGHHPLGPGDTVPAWARPQVGEHLLSRPEPPRAEDALDALIRAEADRFATELETPPVTAPVPDLPPAPGPAPHDPHEPQVPYDEQPRFTVVDPPPVAGPGASRAAWAAYARDIGVEVPGSWNRADIQGACERVATER